MWKPQGLTEVSPFWESFLIFSPYSSLLIYLLFKTDMPLKKAAPALILVHSFPRATLGSREGIPVQSSGSVLRYSGKAFWNCRRMGGGPEGNVDFRWAHPLNPTQVLALWEKCGQRQRPPSCTNLSTAVWEEPFYLLLKFHLLLAWVTPISYWAIIVAALADPEGTSHFLSHLKLSAIFGWNECDVFMREARKKNKTSQPTQKMQKHRNGCWPTSENFL